jgi:hypothetical protein
MLCQLAPPHRGQKALAPTRKNKRAEARHRSSRASASEIPERWRSPPPLQSDTAVPAHLQPSGRDLAIMMMGRGNLIFATDLCSDF